MVDNADCMPQWAPCIVQTYYYASCLHQTHLFPFARHLLWGWGGQGGTCLSVKILKTDVNVISNESNAGNIMKQCVQLYSVSTVFI